MNKTQISLFALQVSREHCLSRNATKPHDSPIFASHFRDRVDLKKKYHSESGLNQRDEDARDFFVKQMPVVPISKTSTGDVPARRRPHG